MTVTLHTGATDREIEFGLANFFEPHRSLPRGGAARAVASPKGLWFNCADDGSPDWEPCRFMGRIDHAMALAAVACETRDLSLSLQARHIAFIAVEGKHHELATPQGGTSICRWSLPDVARGISTCIGQACGLFSQGAP